MMKRVIFDMDNTLMPWKTENFSEIYTALKELNIDFTEEDFLKIKKAFSEYENNYYTFNTKLMIDFINKYTKKNCKKLSLCSIGCAITKKEKIKSIMYFVSPVITAKFINKFRLRKYTKKI